MNIFNFIKSFIIVLMLFPVFVVVLPLGIPAYLSLILLAAILQIYGYFRYNLKSISKNWDRVRGR